MATASSSKAAQSFSTTGTVSSPLDLDAKGEHQTVELSNGKKRKIRPKPKVTLTSLTLNNSGTLRKLNSVVLPIVYSEKFYKEILDPQYDDINKLVYYADQPVGAICCRFENLSSTSSEKPPTLTILTLAVLAPYRDQSLGTALLRNALHACLHPTPAPVPTVSADKPQTRGSAAAPPLRKVVKRALTHVQVGNEGAKRFYERLGFKEKEIIENYYSKMEPRGAVVMVCDDIQSGLGEAPNGSL